MENELKKINEKLDKILEIIEGDIKVEIESPELMKINKQIKEQKHMDIINKIIDFESEISKVIDIKEIILTAKKGKMDEIGVLQVIEKLICSGDIFEPKRGFVSRL